MTREIVFIGFGSNLGDRLDSCDRAVTLLSLLPHAHVVAVSSLYEAEPVDDGAEPGTGWFLNGVVRMETDVTAQSLLEVCLEIERAMGRDLDHRKGPRTIDLDLLFYGSHVITEPDLIVPHPRLHQRRFVLTPLAEIAPEWEHPTLKRTIAQLLAELGDTSVVRRLEPQPSSRYGARPACSAQAVTAHGDS